MTWALASRKELPLDVPGASRGGIVKILRFESLGVGQNDGSLDDILQLPNIPWPGVAA